MLPRLTGLGWVLVSVIGLTLIVAIVILSQPPESSGPAAQKAETPVVGSAETAPIMRVYDGYDAIDFTQLTYEQYLGATASESKPMDRPPYDLNTILRRLESIRPRLSQTLYQSLVVRYTDASVRNGIQRDEVLCGQPRVGGVKASLKIGGNDRAVIAITKIVNGVPEGVVDVTVDLRSRQIVEIGC